MWIFIYVIGLLRKGLNIERLERFGTFLGLAHAAMTAEGDNSVLMQKVAKEVSM